jgi:hypothetical protein
MTILFEQARRSLGRKHRGEERDIPIYINNCLTPERVRFDVEFVWRPTEPEVEVSFVVATGRQRGFSPGR